MPEPSSSIRLATTSDAAAIADIHRAARAEAMPWLPVLHTPAEDLSFFRQNVLPQETVLVAEADGRICGFVAFQKDWLNHLYIATEYWRAGHGTALLHRVQTASTR
ncbi:MAG: GNAT family N-acetyltransferase, partial [Pseudomonadota bacterium]